MEAGVSHRVYTGAALLTSMSRITRCGQCHLQIQSSPIETIVLVGTGCIEHG